VSDVLGAKPGKFTVSGQPDYLLCSKGKSPLPYVLDTLFIHPSWEYLVAVLEESNTFLKTKPSCCVFEGYVFFITVMWVVTKPLVFFKVSIFQDAYFPHEKCMCFDNINYPCASVRIKISSYDVVNFLKVCCLFIKC